MPTGQSPAMCCRIPESLEAVREKGIAYRDLKHRNVKISPEENVTILDFGWSIHR